MASKYNTTNLILFDNEVIQEKLEDQLITALDMNQFITTDYSLQATPGMKIEVHTYKGTGNVEDLADVLLSFNNRGINVDDIRELIDNKYNFNTISATIYQTIYNDIFKNDLSKS